MNPKQTHVSPTDTVSKKPEQRTKQEKKRHDFLVKKFGEETVATMTKRQKRRRLSKISKARRRRKIVTKIFGDIKVSQMDQKTIADFYDLWRRNLKKQTPMSESEFAEKTTLTKRTSKKINDEDVSDYRKLCEFLIKKYPHSLDLRTITNPLTINSHLDIAEQHPEIPTVVIENLLGWTTNRPRYLKLIANGTPRRSLCGTKLEAVTEIQQNKAKEKIQAFRSRKPEKSPSKRSLRYFYKTEDILG